LWWWLGARGSRLGGLELLYLAIFCRYESEKLGMENWNMQIRIGTIVKGCSNETIRVSNCWVSAAACGSSLGGLELLYLVIFGRYESAPSVKSNLYLQQRIDRIVKGCGNETIQVCHCWKLARGEWRGARGKECPVLPQRSHSSEK
jgi:hypothetical protein